jgi:hypothetical protein
VREELGNGDGVVVAMAGWQLWRVIQSQEREVGMASPGGRTVEKAGWPRRGSNPRRGGGGCNASLAVWLGGWVGGWMLSLDEKQEALWLGNMWMDVNSHCFIPMPKCWNFINHPLETMLAGRLCGRERE